MARNPPLPLLLLLATTIVPVCHGQIFAQQGFTDTLVANVPGPTAIAFLPDGRMLVTSQNGTLRIFNSGAGGSAPIVALTIPSDRLCSNSERGLLGVAVDPDFESNSFLYLYYTFRPDGAICGSRTNPMPRNRVSRFRLQNVNNTVDVASEQILLDNMPSWNGNHNGGDLQFGADGLLYVSVGDSGCDPYGTGCAGTNDAARDPNTLLGKILRIDRNGNVPPSNPYTGPGIPRCNTENAPAGVRCQETFASGLRNPFRIAFDRNTSGNDRFFILDVGQNVWEEIDLGIAGADYGWNAREGACVNGSRTNCPSPPVNFTDPIFSYPHGVTVPGTQSSGCDSIAGGAFVPNGRFGPAEFDGSFLFADYVCGSIFRLVPEAAVGASTWRVTEFVRALGGNSAVHLTFGPFNSGQALFYTTYAGGGQIRRIVYADGRPNTAPTAVISANRTSGAVPLSVTFSAAGSADPDAGDTLTYLWDFGDQSQSVTTTTPTTQHTYVNNGVFTATLRVRDQRNTVSEPASIRIFAGNAAPVPTIQSPSASDRFSVGQTITLTASATDAEDGALPASALSWTVILHHDTHTHPFLGPVAGNNITFTAPAPEDLSATGNSYLEIVLRVSDSAGEVTTVGRDFRPILVPVTFETNPPGLFIRVNGLTVTGPSTLTSWAGYVLDFSAPDQDLEGRRYGFAGWSNGESRSQRLATPATALTLTAQFESLAAETDITIVEAASFSPDAIAPASLVSILGQELTGITAISSDGPWPTELAGVQVSITDSAGVSHTVPLYVAAPDVITFEAPPSLNTGRATVNVLRSGTPIRTGITNVERAAPGIFTTTGDGRGIARSSVRANSEGVSIVAIQATGFRNATEIRAQLGGIDVPTIGVVAAGFPGLEEVEIAVPAELIARGDVSLTMSADNKPANLVTIRF
jgi:uncharacterized protein (TIGR03437 family)